MRDRVTLRILQGSTLLAEFVPRWGETSRHEVPLSDGATVAALLGQGLQVEISVPNIDPLYSERLDYLTALELVQKIVYELGGDAPPPWDYDELGPTRLRQVISEAGVEPHHGLRLANFLTSPLPTETDHEDRDVAHPLDSFATIVRQLRDAGRLSPDAASQMIEGAESVRAILDEGGSDG